MGLTSVNYPAADIYAPFRLLRRLHKTDRRIRDFDAQARVGSSHSYA